MDKPRFLMQYPKNPHESERERPGENESKQRPLPEVELVNSSNKVLDRYRELYKNRYGIDPIILNIGIANTQTKDLIRKAGLERAMALVEHYLKLNGEKDWYVRTGHSLRTLENKIEEISTSLAMSNKRASPVGIGYNPMIVFDTQCPNCKGTHSITCRGSEIEKHAYTTLCGVCRN